MFLKIKKKNECIKKKCKQIIIWFPVERVFYKTYTYIKNGHTKINIIILFVRSN